MTLTQSTHALTRPIPAPTLDPIIAGREPAHPTLVHPQRSTLDVLVRNELTGVLLQDLATIPDSIFWLRAQRYWANAGVEVFTSGAVPYAVTNNGEQSRKAVELYLASLRAAEKSGCREDASYVLELGAGSGLFAKLFLDQLRAVSRRDYARTTYIVADYAPGLLEDTRRTGVFADHEDRIRRVHLPTRDWRAALSKALPEALGAIRAIHGNYLLDSLPFTILSFLGDRTFELRIRTLLRKDLLRPGVTVPATTDALEVESWLADVLETVEWSDTALEFEAVYVPVERRSLPIPEMIPEVPVDDASDSNPGSSLQFLHGYGAIEFLSEALSTLRDDGYFVVVDYDIEGARREPIEFQTYGSSVSAGVNFEQLVEFARGRPDCQVGVPPQDPKVLQARCFARRAVPVEVIQLFETMYSRDAHEHLDAPHRAALKCCEVGRFEAARMKFAEAHQLQPTNWCLLQTIGDFLAATLHDYESALQVARRALLLNHLSPALWNLLGDCHYNLGHLDAAEEAYREAVRLSPRDADGVANLANVFSKRGDAAETLRLIGQALALDASGTMREQLLAKQNEALATRLEASRARTRHSWKRRSGLHALPGRVPVPGSSNGVLAIRPSKAPLSEASRTASCEDASK